MKNIVIDTNIVLDLFIFNDPSTIDLNQKLNSGDLFWLITKNMYNELNRVLDYPLIVQKLNFYQKQKIDILNKVNEISHLKSEAAQSIYLCRDSDDQKFIDLAVEYRAQLLSKDKAVLKMKKRLSKIGVHVFKTFDDI